MTRRRTFCRRSSTWRHARISARSGSPTGAFTRPVRRRSSPISLLVGIYNTQPVALDRLFQKRGLEGITRERRELRSGQGEAALERQEVLQQVTAEVRRVVGVDRHAYSFLEQALEIVGFDPVENL